MVFLYVIIFVCIFTPLVLGIRSKIIAYILVIIVSISLRVREIGKPLLFVRISILLILFLAIFGSNYLLRQFMEQRFERRAILQGLYVRTVPKPQDIIDRFNYQGIRITKFTTVNQIKKWVDLAIEKKEWIHFNLHNVAENKKKSQMVEVDISMTDLETIILYISSLSRDGLLEPVTFYKGFEKYKELTKEYLMRGTSLA